MQPRVVAGAVAVHANGIGGSVDSATDETSTMNNMLLNAVVTRVRIVVRMVSTMAEIAVANDIDAGCAASVSKVSSISSTAAPCLHHGAC